MGGIVRVLAAGVVAAAFSVASGRAAVILESLVVRVYDNAGVLAGDRQRAIKRANEILARAEVAIDWRDCPAGAAWMHAGCADMPRPGELSVRLVRTPKNDANPRALGSALIDKVTGRGTLATVFVDRIRGVAQQGKTDPWAIVGRVMAHEIGHLLLGTNSHSETGLMREMWALKDLLRGHPDDWLFSRKQRDDLRNSPLLKGTPRPTARVAVPSPAAGG
jgi:hypothetical protein